MFQLNLYFRDTDTTIQEVTHEREHATNKLVGELVTLRRLLLRQLRLLLPIRLLVVPPIKGVVATPVVV